MHWCCFRSCQTCRNNATERKRYLSKSREAIFEKVSRNSNLKKSLSKSRERLCDMRLAISKSRENIHNHGGSSSATSVPQRKTSRDETGFRQSLSRSDEDKITRLFGFRLVMESNYMDRLISYISSRSQEVLSHALGSAMKRVAVNGTVSDISHALTTGCVICKSARRYPC